MTRDIDLTLRPTEKAGEAMIALPHVLQVYESSIGGMLTVVLRDPRDPRYITAGTRLTRGQATELSDALNLWLKGETVADAYNRGYDNGKDVGYDQGFDHGYERGSDFESSR
jgi:hypothetical protein